MSFEDNIKKWVSYDNEIKQINEKLKQLREKKNNLSLDIFNYVNENNINDSVVKINDGKLKFTNVKVMQPLTYKFIEESLLEIINDKDNVKQIINYLKQKRDGKYVEEIKRFYR